MRSLLTLIAAVALLLSASVAVVASPVQAAAPAIEPGECRFQLPSGQVDGETVDCGFLVVPEKRADPGSRSIRIAIAVFHPPGGLKHTDPVVYLEGGPGGSPLKLLAIRDFDTLFGPLLAQGRDVILVDQRGVGRSEPALECPAFVELYVDLLDRQLDGERLDGDAIRALKVAALAECAATLSTIADLSAYNTTENAADIEDMRVALGYQRLNLWGTSYGSRLALDVMRDHGDGVRSAVLDAPFPPEVDLYSAPDAFGRALEEVFVTCAADPACDAAFPNLEAAFLETVERLSAEPVPTTLHDPISGQRVPLLMDGDAFLEQVFRGLYSTAMRQALPGVIYDAREGTFDTLLLIGQLDVLRQHFRSWGMYFSVLCHDEVPFSSLESFEASRARHPALAGMYDHFELGPLAYEACAAWGAGAAAAVESQPVHSAIPTLIMTGQFDPIVPPTFGRNAAATLENAWFLEFPGISHGASGSDCATPIMLGFLDDPAASPDASCLLQTAALSFDLPIEATAVVMEPYRSEDLGLSGVSPMDWSELAPGTFARGQSATDHTSLALLRLPFDADEAVARLGERFGSTEPLVSSDRIEAEGLAWDIYRTDIQGAVVDTAIAPAGAGTVVVMLTSAASEREMLYADVFLPAVAALAPLQPSD